MLGPSLEEAPAEHPWLDTFLASPKRELDNLLFGYARVEPYEAVSPRDLARLLFSPLSKAHPAIATLDHELSVWLSARCARDEIEESTFKRDRKLHAIADALRLVSLIPLPGSAKFLRLDLDAWLSWLSGFSRQSKLDVRAEYLSTLALTQRLVAESDPHNPFELEPFWLKIPSFSAR